MPPKRIKETLVLIINTGVASYNAEINSSLLEKAKEVAKRKIEKMIFTSPKDEVAIILMGSSTTKNKLNAEHVHEFVNFQVPNWDIIKSVLALQSTEYCSNWVEALEVAIEFMQQNVIDNCLKKVILMSDFNEDVDIISQFQSDVIASRLSNAKVNLITLAEQSLDERPVTSLSVSEVLLKSVHNKINGVHITFDNALFHLKFYGDKPTKPFPCYFTLELVDIKIPVVSFVKTDQKTFPSWKKAKGNQKVKSCTQYLDRQRNIYNKDEIVTGYKYGGTFTAIEKELQEAMSYKSGMKSYKIYGFTDKNNIDFEHLYEKNTRIILPSNSTNTTIKPFYTLMQAMYETNSVAIVRKVFRNNCTPRMVALFPCIDIPDEPWCFVEVALAYAEDRRISRARPMRSIVKQLTSEQNEAVDNLIDSLMLPDIEAGSDVDEAKCFLPGCTPCPAVQHRFHMLSYRAINPGKPLPPMEDYLKEVLEDASIKERSKPNLHKILSLFRLETFLIDPRAKRNVKMKTGDNIQVGDVVVPEECNKMEEKTHAESDSYEKSAMYMDDSDVDFDELVANI